MENSPVTFIICTKKLQQLQKEKLFTGLRKIFSFIKKRLFSLMLLVTLSNASVSENSSFAVFAAEKGTSSNCETKKNQDKPVDENSDESNVEITGERPLEEENESYDTTEAEVAYGLAFLDHLPKRGEEGFNYFLELPEFSTLKSDRKEILKAKNGFTQETSINEQEIYHQIEATVKKIIKKVDDRALISKHGNRSKNLRIAKAIYRWVAKNISYDIDSVAGSGIQRKPQDAFFVYNMKTGVCLGYAQLSDLMLKIAGIPSNWIATIRAKKGYRHGFNIVYIEDDVSGQIGWTLFDPTWASSKLNKNHVFNHEIKEEREGSTDEGKLLLRSVFNGLPPTLSLSTKCDEELAQEQKKVDDSFHGYFPAFYNTNKTLLENNKNFLRKRHHKIGGFLRFNINIDGVYFCLTGCETHACIEVLSCYKENFCIPKELSCFKIPFKIGMGIKSLILNGDEEVDLSDCIDLEKIDVTHSTKYFREGNELYERKQNGKLIKINICKVAPIARSHL